MSYAKLGMAAFGAAAAYGMSRGRGRRDESNFELGRSQAYSDAFGGGAPGIRELHRMLKDIESGGMSFDPSLAEGYKHEAKRILAAAGGKPSISLQEYHDWEDAGGSTARGRRANGYVGEAEQFAALLRKKYSARGIRLRFDKKSRTGSAWIGSLAINFSDSTNDPAVIVWIKESKRLKGSPENVLAALNKIQEGWDLL